MKKITTLFLTLFTTVLSYGQITLDASDFGVVGDTVVVGRDTLLTGISLGSPGANQIWDYSSFVIESYNINRFIDPTTTPNGASFPSATVAYASSSLTSYVEASASQVQLVGYEGDVGAQLGGAPSGVSLDIPFNKPQTMIEFPANYNDEFNDTSFFDKAVDADDVDPSISNFVDSIRLVHHSTSTHKFDAFGTLILLNDTQEVLRKEKVEFLIDTIWVKTVAGGWMMPTNFPGYFDTNPIYDTLTSYEYYAKGRKFPMATINVSPQGNLEYATFLADSMLIVDAFALGQISCSGTSTGTLNVDVLDLGTPPYTYTWSTGASTQQLGSLAAGDYFVTVADANGKLGLGNATLIDPSVIVVTADVFPSSCPTCSDGAIDLTVSGGTVGSSNPYSYSWSVNSTSSTLTGLPADTYDVTVTDGNGCTETASFNVGAIPTSIEELEENNSLTVYPNPTNGQITVNSKDIQIINLLGSVVFENTNLSSGNIDVSGLKKGIYFVRSNNFSNQTIRLIVQ